MLPPHLQKPDACRGCLLHSAGRGFVPPSGPPAAKILLVGESPGSREVETRVPFSGPAGGKLGHILYRLSRERDSLRVHNLISCQPPQDKLAGTHYEYAALAHCAPNLTPVLDENHLVIVPLGAVPARHLLGIDANIKDLHGTVTRLDRGGFTSWVVPTFHPSHLVRGAHNLTGTVLYDLNRAFEIADAGGWVEDKPVLYCDPSPEFFQKWVEKYLQLLAQDPARTWLAVDVETPDKSSGADEGELKSSVDRSMTIIRINFSYSTEEGLTVPFVEPYISIMRPMLEAEGGVQCYWNKSYDLKRLRQHFKRLGAHQLDWMDGWKALHSDTPRGLGFVAPFYSKWGPWKHLSGGDPVLYAAGDSLQTIRCAFGIAADLQSNGMWDIFWRHMHEFGVYATSPACEIGLKIDRKALEGWEDAEGVHHPGMREQLQAKSDELFEAMQGCVPDELKPLHPKDGWTRRPEGETYEFEGAPRAIIEKSEPRPVKVCSSCGASQITVKHRCKDKSLTPQVENRVIPVPRYYVREDFNPASPVQVMAYIKWAAHKPGREKGKETTNRETIERLADAKPKNKRDEAARDLYHHLLDYRDIEKVKGTYVEGTLRRLALDREAGITDDRLHPTVTNNPSTLRTAMADPNLQNVVADRRGGESLSAGFRKAVVAEAGCSLVEVDWSSIEAVIVGWLMGDPAFIKKAWTGVHDWVTADVAGKPIPEDLPIDETLRRLAQIKEEEDRPGGKRDPVKRVVHGCVPGDHEVLTPAGWVRFDELQDGQEVAAWHPGGKIRFEVPKVVTRVTCQDETLVSIRGRGIAVKMTHDHRVPVRANGRLQEWRAADLLTKDYGRIPVTGELAWDQRAHGLSSGMLSRRLRLEVAVQADSQLCPNADGTARAVFHLVRKRKIERLRELLQGSGLRWTDKPCKCHPKGRRFRVKLPELHLLNPDKTFSLPALLSRLSLSGRDEFLEEILLWDGTVLGHRKAYLTCDKVNAVAVQTLAHLSNRQGLLREIKASEGSYRNKIMYSVSLNRRQWSNNSCSGVIEVAAPKQVYCVTTSSGYFLVKYTDRISVTGNTNYLLTPYGMAKRFRKLFPSAAIAEDLQRRYYAFAKKLGPWQRTVQDLAYRQEYIGGAGVHPFAYKHEFYNVRNFEPVTDAQATRMRNEGMAVVTQMNGRWYRVTPGDDARRAVAFFPQSIAGGVIRETSVLLFKPGESVNYIGDVFFGKTPLRAPIHDSFLLEVPDSRLEEVIDKVATEMTRPIVQLPCPAEWGLGPYLQFGVAVKVGKNWAEMKKVKVPQPWLEVLKGAAGMQVEGVGDDVVLDEVWEEGEYGEAVYA